MNIDRFKCRVWIPERKTYLYPTDDKDQAVLENNLPKDEYWTSTEYMVANHYRCVEEITFYQDNPRKVEMCTGLKDAGGTLIYEGDLVYIPEEDEVGTVIYDEVIAQFAIVLDDIQYSFDNLPAYELEVRGNLNEWKAEVEDANN